MVEPVSIAVGGVIGAIIALVWSDPFRDNRGRYTSRQNGYRSWVMQAIIGAFLGAGITTVLVALLIANPLIVLAALIGLSYFAYVKYVDPR